MPNPENRDHNPQGLMISDEERDVLLAKGKVQIKLYPRDTKGKYPEFKIGQTIDLGEAIGRPNQIDLSNDNIKVIITNITPVEKTEFQNEQIEVTFELAEKN